MEDVAYISPKLCLDHQTGPGHPERPARLDAINQYLKQSGQLDDLTVVSAREASPEEVISCHGSDHVERVSTLIKGGASALDPDTVVSSQSLTAAWLAVGSALTGIDLLKQKKHKRVFCGVRPPGHHAESNRAMGFCIFNNIAVAAEYAIQQGLAERVLILDWDVHHGNGTQEIFEASNQVYYYSLHQYPYYPGTGGEHEKGRGSGEGFTMNRPMATGMGDDDYQRALEKDLDQIATSFKPELILISAGFDAHAADPLGGMQVTSDGFARMTQQVMDMADTCCEGRILSVLEGGYNLNALAESVSVHLQTMMN